jgi:hypothetical protein
MATQVPAQLPEHSPADGVGPVNLGAAELFRGTETAVTSPALAPGVGCPDGQGYLPVT